MKYTTDENQLTKLLSKKLPLSFRGIYSSYELVHSPRAMGWPVQPPHALIINTDSKNLPGKHWVAIYITENGQGEVMDTHRWINNKYLIQPPKSDSCGQFCADYLIRRSLADSMDSVLAIFTTNLHANEKSVLSRIRV